MKYLFSFAFCFAAVAAFAQHVPLNFEAPERMSVVQVDNSDGLTRVYIEFSAPQDSVAGGFARKMNVSDKTYISVPGKERKFRLVSSRNMLIDCEGEHKFMLFDEPGQKHRYALEFEKIPDDCKLFNIIETVDDTPRFCIYNITLDTDNPVELIDADDFMSEYPVKEYGSMYTNGILINFIRSRDLAIYTYAGITDLYGDFLNVNINVQNFGNNSILFNPDAITAQCEVIAKMPKKKKLTRRFSTGAERTAALEQLNKEYEEAVRIAGTPVLKEAKVLSLAEYDKIVANKQSWQSFWVALGEGVGDALRYSVYSPNYRNGTVEYLIDRDSNARWANFRNEQRQIRQSIGDGYVKLNTIPVETEYSGFFNIKLDKNAKLVDCTINIAGEPYTFTFVLPDNK